MKTLNTISVTNNALTSLPFSLGEMKHLKVLKVAGNPWSESMPELFEVDASQMAVPVTDHEAEARITLRIKKHLRGEAAAMESGGGSE